jgi:hypothetical protein
MAWNIIIYGNSTSCAYLASYFARQGHHVQWTYRKRSISLRPQRLRRKQIKSIVSLLGSQGITSEFLLSAPEVMEWQAKSGIFPRQQEFWRSFKEEHIEKWVNDGELFNALRECAQKLKVETREISGPAYPSISQKDVNKTIRIADLSEDEIELWPQKYVDKDSEFFECEVSELVLPNSRGLKPGRAQIYHIDGAHVILESINSKELSLTLLSRSRYLLNRAMQRLKKADHEELPLTINVLYAGNPNHLRKDYKTRQGESGIYLPLCFTLGKSTGHYPLLMNKQKFFQFEQASRLIQEIELLKKVEGPKQSELLYASYENWQLSERKFFQKSFTRMRQWERLICSPNNEKWVLSAQSILPPFVTELLKSPL